MYLSTYNIYKWIINQLNQYIYIYSDFIQTIKFEPNILTNFGRL